MSDKQMLLKKIRTCAFTLTDAILYLDSHPNCNNALEYFRKHKEMYLKAVKEYEETYGPLTALGVTDENKWTWSTTAFPWERSEN